MTHWGRQRPRATLPKQPRINPMPRPGAFAANFTPEVLEQFRNTCRSKGLMYSKVLEQLAILYLETDGECLDSKSQPVVSADAFQALMDRVFFLETHTVKL